VFNFNLRNKLILSNFLIILIAMTLGSGFTYFFWQDEWNSREELFRKIITENLGEELKKVNSSNELLKSGYVPILRFMKSLNLDPETRAVGLLDSNKKLIAGSPKARLMINELDELVLNESLILEPIFINETPQEGLVQEKAKYFLFFEKSIIDPSGLLIVLITISFGMIFLVSVFISVAISRQVISPITKLAAASKKIGQGIYEPLEIKNTKSEVGYLASSFNQMSEKIKVIENQREQLFSDIAHELRNPLTALKVNIEGIIESKIKPDTNKFNQMNDQISLLSNLINDLSLIATAESGELKLNKKKNDLSILVKDISEIFYPSAKENGVSIENSFSDSLLIDYDENRVRQIISNIISNGVKHLNKGNTLKIILSKYPDYYLLSFLDNGPGIPSDQIDNIFDRFYKTDVNRGRNNLGSGLGLSIAKQLVLAHGWSIHANSEYKKGTEFLISIPKS
tara:strand:- start:448 stop:1815 length:1368 start_codon:yes stop_codon:yes gene_type:complete